MIFSAPFIAMNNATRNLQQTVNRSILTTHSMNSNHNNKKQAGTILDKLDSFDLKDKKGNVIAHGTNVPEQPTIPPMPKTVRNKSDNQRGERMKITYDGVYHIELKYPYTDFHVGTDNVQDAKRNWLNMLSNLFDESVNKQLYDWEK